MMKRYLYCDTTYYHKMGDIILQYLVESKRTTQEPMEVPTQCPSAFGSGLRFEDEGALLC